MKLKEAHDFATSYSNEDKGGSREADILHFRKLPHRGNTRRSRFRKAVTSATRNPCVTTGKRNGGSVPGRRSRPETPLLKWKVGETSRNGKMEEVEEDEKSEEIVRSARKEKVGIPLSVRKLAAELWHMQLTEAVGSRDEGERLSLQPASHVGITFGAHQSEKMSGEADRLLQSPCTNSRRSRTHSKPSYQFSNSAMEGATKWDPINLEASDFQIYGEVKHSNQRTSSTSVLAGLRAELEQTRTRVEELETERRMSKKKLEHFLKKLSQERAAWRAREHEKVRAYIDDVKESLSREKKNRQRLELVNSKLVNELADSKMSAKRFLQDYEKERKARQLIEEVCDELAKEIGGDKAEVEAVQREAMKIKEEVDDERKMLQMAEVWREERVQMKLIDAKVALDEKYSQMNKLVVELESFLRTKSANPDQKEINEAELLLRVAGSVNIQDFSQIRYEPPNPDEMFSMFEGQAFSDPNEREIELCTTYSPVSPDSKIHTVSPELNMIHGQQNSRHHGSLEDDESGWETVSRLEEQDSSYSPEGSFPSVNRHRRDSNASESVTEWEDNTCCETPLAETGELSSLPTKHSKKPSSMGKLWRTVSQNGDSVGDDYKVISVDPVNGKLANGRKSNANNGNADKVSSKGGISPIEKVEQWSSPDSGNPHVTRGMIGCIEWPRGIQKTNTKTKLYDSKADGHKVQLRHVLKQKI